MRNFWMLLGVVMACAASPALAQVNKWVDEKGRVQYGDQPPTGKAVVKPASAPKTSPVVNPNKPPPQPKLHVPGDPADLARAITAVLDDESLAARLGGHGHALAQERCSAAGMAAEHESLYRSLTGSDARPSASRSRR